MSYHHKRPSAHWDPARQGVLSGPQLYTLGFDPFSTPTEPTSADVSISPNVKAAAAGVLAFPLIMAALTIGGGYLIYRALKK